MKTQKAKSKIQFLFWIVLAGILIFLAFNRHSKTGIYYFRSQIYGDKAGYYVYLPATFIYSFNARSFPHEVDRKTGNGFQLDTSSNKVITKYYYGISLLQMPFFIAAHLLAKHVGFEPNGFSLIYHWALDLAAVFYLLLSFFLLYKTLRNLYPSRIAILTISILFVGTNLFYYSILEGSMSHIYSFFLFSFWLYQLYSWKTKKDEPVQYGFILGLMAALIVFVRPLNILFLFMTLFFNNDFQDRLRAQMQWKFIFPFLFATLLVASPQLAYWKYLSNSWFYYSYGMESFSNWNNPQILEFLFAPNNGLFLYNPIVLITFIGLVMMVLRKMENAWIIIITIVILIYASSSWWMWNFGCGFSARNFVEYYALLSFPLAYIIQQRKSTTGQLTLYFFIFLFCAYNIKMIYSYGGCWFGDGDWDWSQYQHWLLNWPS